LRRFTGNLDEVAIQELSEKSRKGIQLVLNENAVRFDTNKSSLTADAKANLS
jgi:outer membrane protein OmpA-like peptidoglycan-associated protein